MKFNRYLPIETKEFLEKQYKEYIKVTPMTAKEQRAVREWVKDGHSVYENASGVWAEGGVPVEFLTVWRDEEYIRRHTKGMTPEDTQKFAMEYYGWSDDTEFLIQYGEPDSRFISLSDKDEELPFQ